MKSCFSWFFTISVLFLIIMYSGCVAAMEQSPAGDLPGESLSNETVQEPSLLIKSSDDRGNTSDFRTLDAVPGRDHSTLNNDSLGLSERPYSPDRLIVKYKPEALRAESFEMSRQDLHSHAQSETLSDFSDVGLPGLEILKIPDGNLSHAISVYQQDPNVEYVEPDYIIETNISPVESPFEVFPESVPNDPSYSLLWGLHNTGQSGGNPDADIDAPEAWDMSTGSDSVIIAVVDSGVDYTHQDLAANIWVNVHDPVDGIDNDGNGYVDDYQGWDFFSSDNDPSDDNGHGTHCAGIIAAVGNNGIGVTGVNWNAKIMPLKFLNAAGSGYTSGAVSAILYANKMGAKVISNSWGGSSRSQALKDAIDASSAVVVCAAGNGGSDGTGDDNDVSPHYPSSFDSPQILSVASLTRSDALASYSNYGVHSVDIGAPGSEIYSTYPGSGYRYMSGTSMATPFVSGVAALLLAKEPSLSNIAVIQRILGSAEPVASLNGISVTGGRVNAYRALNGESVSPTVAPTSSPTLIPTAVPTVSPTGSPTVAPTSSPTLIPTAVPTVSPTGSPTVAPTSSPTLNPTAVPTVSPTGSPTVAPTSSPTLSPTVVPTVSPTGSPTVAPTSPPTLNPTAVPTVSPTGSPTVAPTSSPTLSPTVVPTVSPTGSPTVAPTSSPTLSPTVVPTVSPTISPTATKTPVQTPVPGRLLASFTADPVSGSAPLTIRFTDHSYGNPELWFWYFNDGTFSSRQNPVKTYRAPGTYSVMLLVRNNESSDFTVMQDLVHVTVT